MPENSQNNKSTEFSELAKQKRTSWIVEFWFFLKHNKKWWLLPILLLLLIFCFIAILGGTPLAPFIYPLF